MRAFLSQIHIIEEQIHYELKKNLKGEKLN
jgi:hypothetical protein